MCLGPAPPFFYAQERQLFHNLIPSHLRARERRFIIKMDSIVIFLHLYNQKRNWKSYPVNKIKEIEDKRHSQVLKMIQSFQ